MERWPGPPLYLIFWWLTRVMRPLSLGRMDVLQAAGAHV